MKKYYGHYRFYQLIEEIKELHSKKNYGYSENKDPLSNLRASEAMGVEGWKGVIIRLTDKFSRVMQLAKGKPDIIGESLKDTLQDISVYALLCIILYEEWLKKK